MRPRFENIIFVYTALAKLITNTVKWLYFFDSIFDIIANIYALSYSSIVLGKSK
jgi:hypothetical protein